MLGANPVQAVYLHRTYSPGVKDTYSVSVQVDNNPAIRGKLVVINSNVNPNTRQMMFYDERSLRSAVGLREPMVAIFDQNGMIQGADVQSPKPVYMAFGLASFIPVGAIAVDRSAGTTYENANVKVLAMSHVENGSNINSYANIETVATIQPRNGRAVDATIQNTVILSSGKLDHGHLELRRSPGSILVADFQLLETKG